MSGSDCFQQYIRFLVTKAQEGILLLTVAGETCSCKRVLKLVPSELTIQTTKAKGSEVKSSSGLTFSPNASGIDQGRTGWVVDVPMDWFKLARFSGCCGSRMPLSFNVKGMKERKKPSLHESGQKRSMAPVALVHETTAWSVWPVNLVCLGIKTTECLTLALALEIEVPMTMKLAKSLEEFSRASLTSVIVRDCHSLPVLFSRVARKESVLLLLDSSMASEVKSFVKRSFKHLQGQKKPKVKPLLCE